MDSNETHDKMSYSDTCDFNAFTDNLDEVKDINHVSGSGESSYECAFHSKPLKYYVSDMNLFICNECKNDYKGCNILKFDELVEETIPAFLTSAQHRFLIDSLRCSNVEIEEAFDDIKFYKDIKGEKREDFNIFFKNQCRLLRLYESSTLYSKLLVSIDLILKPREKKEVCSSIIKLMKDESEPNTNMSEVHTLYSFLVNEDKINKKGNTRQKYSKKEEKSSFKQEHKTNNEIDNEVQKNKNRYWNNENLSSNLDFNDLDDYPDDYLEDMSQKLFNAIKVLEKNLNNTKLIIEEVLHFLMEKRCPKFDDKLNEDVKRFCSVNDVWYLDIHKRKLLTYLYYNNLVRYPAFDGFLATGPHQMNCKYSSFPNSKKLYRKTTEIRKESQFKDSKNLYKVIAGSGPIMDMSISNLGYLVCYNGSSYTLTIYKMFVDEENDFSFPFIKISECNQWMFTAVFNDNLVIAACYGSKLYKCRISELWEFVEYVQKNKKSFHLDNNLEGIPFELTLSYHVFSVHYVPEIHSLWVNKDRCSTERTMTYVTSSNGICVVDVQTMDRELYEYDMKWSKLLIRRCDLKRHKKIQERNTFYIDELPGTITREIYNKLTDIPNEVDSSLHYLCSPKGIVDTAAEFCRQVIFATTEGEPTAAKKYLDICDDEAEESKINYISVSRNIPIPILISCERSDTNAKTTIPINNDSPQTKPDNQVSGNNSIVSSPESSDNHISCTSKKNEQLRLGLLELSEPLFVIPRQKSLSDKDKNGKNKDLRSEMNLKSDVSPPFGVTGESTTYRRGFGGLLPDDSGGISTKKWIWVKKSGAIVSKAKGSLGKTVGVKPTPYVSYVRLWDNIWLMYDDSVKSVVCISVEMDFQK